MTTETVELIFLDNFDPFQADALELVRAGSSVVLGTPTGQGKTLPLIAASLRTGKAGVQILSSFFLKGQDFVYARTA